MHTLVTGAGGFIGTLLCDRLLARAQSPDSRYTFVDRGLCARPDATNVRVLQSDLASGAELADIVQSADVVYHLAAVPGGASESDYALSRRVNLDLALAVLEASAARTRPARVIYASSIAVYGLATPDEVDDDTPPRPSLTYGAHKLMVETALADLSRRGRIDGLALRLPGIVARPGSGEGLRSAFMSNLFHAYAHGRPYTVPTSPDATVWVMSADRAVDNLLHGAQCGGWPAGTPRALTLPVMRVTVGELAAAVGRAVGTEPPITYEPDPDIEAQFGRLPPLKGCAAGTLGFASDGTIDALVARALAAAGLSGCIRAGATGRAPLE